MSIDLLNLLPKVLLRLICEYSQEYELDDWASGIKLNWKSLSANYNAVDFLSKHDNKIDWGWLCANENL